MQARRTALSTALLAMVLVACRSTPDPVPIVADPADLARLAGEWSGYYRSPSVGRSGSISFRLEAGRDTAFGDVVMVPRGWSEPLTPAENPAAAARGAPIPETLSIRFVRIEGGLVSGTMAPYKDPDCGCGMYTTFEGELAGDTIEGTFTARPAHGSPYRGTWLVKRKIEGEEEDGPG